MSATAVWSPRSKSIGTVTFINTDLPAPHRGRHGGCAAAASGELCRPPAALTGQVSSVAAGAYLGGRGEPGVLLCEPRGQVGRARPLRHHRQGRRRDRRRRRRAAFVDFQLSGSWSNCSAQRSQSSRAARRSASVSPAESGSPSPSSAADRCWRVVSSVESAGVEDAGEEVDEGVDAAVADVTVVAGYFGGVGEEGAGVPAGGDVLGGGVHPQGGHPVGGQSAGQGAGLPLLAVVAFGGGWVEFQHLPVRPAVHLPVGEWFVVHRRDGEPVHHRGHLRSGVGDGVCDRGGLRLTDPAGGQGGEGFGEHGGERGGSFEELVGLDVGDVQRRGDVVAGELDRVPGSPGPVRRPAGTGGPRVHSPPPGSVRSRPAGAARAALPEPQRRRIDPSRGIRRIKIEARIHAASLL